MNKGIIYMIRSLNSNHIYIGSTIQSLSIRKSKHIYDSKKPLRSKPIHKFINDNDGWDNFVMEKLNEVEYETITELHLKEKEIIQEYKNNDNYKLLNKHSLCY